MFSLLSLTLYSDTFSSSFTRLKQGHKTPTCSPDLATLFLCVHSEVTSNIHFQFSVSTHSPPNHVCKLLPDFSLETSNRLSLLQATPDLPDAKSGWHTVGCGSWSTCRLWTTKNFIHLDDASYLDVLPLYILLLHSVPGRLVFPRGLPLVFPSHSIRYIWVDTSIFLTSTTKLASSTLKCPQEFYWALTVYTQQSTEYGIYLFK